MKINVVLGREGNGKGFHQRELAASFMQVERTLPSSHLKGDLEGLNDASNDDQPLGVHSHPKIVGPAHSVHQPAVHVQLQPLQGDAESHLVPVPIAQEGHWEPEGKGGGTAGNFIPHLTQEQASPLSSSRVPHVSILSADTRNNPRIVTPPSLVSHGFGDVCNHSRHLRNDWGLGLDLSPEIGAFLFLALFLRAATFWQSGVWQ